MVADGHIQWTLFDRRNWLGVYAVFGFYTLSGYLMTRVLHETYGYGVRNFARYIANRALRIYPPYWVSIGLTLALALWLPTQADPTIQPFQVPVTATSYLRNFGLLGMFWDYTPALLPTAFSLHIELIFYVLMGLGLASSKSRAFAWFGLSLAWTVIALWFGTSFPVRYSTVIGASLPFSAGACVYFLADWRRPWMKAAPLLFLPHALVAPYLWRHEFTTGFYASFALVPIAVLALGDVKLPARWAAWDRRLGDLSYPIFLLHIPLIYLARVLWNLGPWSSFTAFLIVLPMANVAGIALHLGLVVPLERARARLRSRALEAHG
jgi:peptidoglycan/LPS O-acetylase OafA/YrhL